ncbi:type I restriction endonuclease EcoAI subunit S [Desulfosarcina widdelii]|uniref:Type I restriction endonuclease EcoAI subunit S n=2 Tax=Desulfosarcina widdelii TaxID=947919 RepID=A0A5K7YVM2_9BACT|nr:type I restriction endonuclease EcoAI subunit S [Desulfosarcina widdelii]
MLEKIADEKNQYVREGIIKDNKPLTPVDISEVPYKLPKSWAWVRIRTICHDLGQKKPDKIFTYIDVTSINKEKGIIENKNNVLSPDDAPSRARKIAKNGTVLYSTVRPYLLNIAIIDENLDPEPIVSTAFSVLHPHSGICNRYIFYYLRSKPFIEYVENAMTGMAYPAINDAKMNLGYVPLPPTNEQKRIVTKIDELLALCDDLETRKKQANHTCIKVNNASINKLISASTPDKIQKQWNRIHTNFNLLYSKPENIDKLRQAILKLAVQGKLVPKDPNDEPASVLLEKVRTEQKRKIKESKLRETKPIKPITPDDIPTSIPSGWGCERFGNIALISGGVTKGRKLAGRKTGYYPYLRVANVQRWHLDLNEVKEIEIPVDELDKYKLENDDILITEGGDWDKVGRAAVWEGQIETCLHQNHIFKARLSCDEIEKKWLLLFINSPVGREYFENSSKQTTNLASINMTQLKHCPVYIPPVNEQIRIINKVDELLSLCDDLERQLNEGESCRNRLIGVFVSHLLAA